MNIGVILAAGKSTRFNSFYPKQLFPLKDKPIVQHSIDLLSKHLDKVLIVTNSECKDDIEGNIIVNDNDSRLESIQVALEQIDKCDNILIQDAARPFVTDVMIENLLSSSVSNYHSQYYLPLFNGLAKKTNVGYEIPDRNDFIELCSPQITKFEVFKVIFETYIKMGQECEILPVVSKFQLPYNLIQGHYKYLRKITTLEDIF
jgi:2-C-methyl-D-erythritol 4-phosphate cytidylyltransferase